MLLNYYRYPITAAFLSIVKFLLNYFLKDVESPFHLQFNYDRTDPYHKNT